MTESIKGRGASFNPQNRFESISFEPIDVDWDDGEEGRAPQTVFYRDSSKSIFAKNDSPDVPFTFSINPYRGCEHGCIYCYARPTHEYLGFSAGVDFETKIMVKEDAPKLLGEALNKPGWEPQTVALSGNTDCYQPVERKLQLTRRCLEVFLKYRNPVGIITKNHLITRDIDILRELASLDLVFTCLSITSLDPELTRVMEPRTSSPAKKLEAIELLSSNGIPVGVNIAPVIPGLNDEEIPAILKEAAARGARSAGKIMLRLPYAVKPLFLDWLIRNLPDRAPKIINRIKDVRGGELSDARFGNRMSGDGEIADAIKQLFNIHCEKYGLNKDRLELSKEHFRRERKGQLEMFG